MKRMKTLCGGLLALLLCIALPSCSDDDDENNHAQTEQEAQRGMLELLNLKMNLCLVNLKGEPTKATFGVAMSEANKTERIYYTKDLESAKKRFQLLFHSDTKCSADGCTYTLANKQGTATFAAGSGNKGELAVATFDVPGLKGLVTKVHFIDYTQRGENTTALEERFKRLHPADLVGIRINEKEKRFGIVMGRLNGSDEAWVIFSPSIQKDLDNYRPTGFIDQTMIDDQLAKINLMDYIEKFSIGEINLLWHELSFFLFGGLNCAGDPEENMRFIENEYRAYWGWGHWNNTSFFFQVQNETTDTETTYDYLRPIGGTTKCVYNRYHMLLEKNKFDCTTLWNLSTTVVSNFGGISITEEKLPKEFERGLPLWTTVSTLTKGQYFDLYRQLP